MYGGDVLVDEQVVCVAMIAEVEGGGNYRRCDQCDHALLAKLSRHRNESRKSSNRSIIISCHLVLLFIAIKVYLDDSTAIFRLTDISRIEAPT